MSQSKYLCLIPLAFLGACAPAVRSPGPAVQDGLALSRVELYRNGVGYFERTGKLEGNTLTLKVRKDQVNDLLKSLTVIDKSSGRPLSVTLPLDPQSWQNAAQVDFTRGSAGLAPILQTLRGTPVRVRYGQGKDSQEAEGRIAMVQENGGLMQLGLLDNETLRLVPLDQLNALTLLGGDVALQLHRNLDAAMGEGMFQQVEVTVRLNEAPSHEVLLGYVVEAPKWKPSYRLVLDSENPGQGLLQSWAVVDNTSGESWNEVNLNLTSGAPIAFRYNLHTPQNVTRPDLTQNQTDRQVQVAIEQSSQTAKMKPMASMAAAAPMAKASLGTARAAKAQDSQEMDGAEVTGWLDNPSAVFVLENDEEYEAVDETGIANAKDREFLEAQAKAREPLVASVQISGLTQYQLQDKVTLPNGTASMVALISKKVPGRQFFLYNMNGAGKGYRYNPYRAVRFQNETPFALEPGPLSIYSNGHFVGEGITDVVGAGAVTTIPFAVETGITVQSSTNTRSGEYSLFKIAGGVLHVRTVKRIETDWKVRGALDEQGYDVMVKHGKSGGDYELKSSHEGLEDNPGYWLVPIKVKPGEDSAQVTVLEEAPGTETLSFWSSNALDLLAACLKAPRLDSASLKVLRPVVEKRQEMASAERKIQTLEEQQRQYDSRLRELRKNLDAIAKDKKAETLRNKMSKDLLEFTDKSNALGRDIVELRSRVMVLKIELQDLLKDLNLDNL